MIAAAAGLRSNEIDDMAVRISLRAEDKLKAMVARQVYKKHVRRELDEDLLLDDYEAYMTDAEKAAKLFVYDVQECCQQMCCIESKQTMFTRDYREVNAV